MVWAESSTEPVEAEGEMTNHRTEEPSLAAWTAATSPTPPGGEMTTRFWLVMAIWRLVSCLFRDDIVCDGRNALADPKRMMVAAVRRFIMVG